MTTSVREVLDANKGIGPGFHLLRHVLSIVLVAHHSRQAIWWTDSARLLEATGGAVNPVNAVNAVNALNVGVARASQFNLEDIVRPALPSLVGMFFALSGFLIAGSALRTRTTGQFLTNRALRIFPALGMETLLSAFVLGPIVTSLAVGAYFTHPEFYRYMGNLVGWVYFYLPGVFEANPLPRVVNGQLWTLQPEFWCYLIMAALMVTGIVFKRFPTLVLTALAMAGLTALYLLDPVAYPIKFESTYSTWYITLMFWFGVVYFLYAEKIPVNLPLFLFAGLAYWASVFFNVLTPLSGIALTYVMVYIGMMAFPWWDRLIKSDYSYGIFLYHFPIIQTVMWVLDPTAFGQLPNVVQFVVVFPLSLAITIGFAAMSWRFVEKPALGLRKIFARTKSVTGEIPPASKDNDKLVVSPAEAAN